MKDASGPLCSDLIRDFRRPILTNESDSTVQCAALAERVIVIKHSAGRNLLANSKKNTGREHCRFPGRVEREFYFESFATLYFEAYWIAHCVTLTLLTVGPGTIRTFETVGPAAIRMLLIVGGVAG